jgi:hypothetical protein
MKTLKISLVATIASTIAWWLRLPHNIWPGHPYLADFLLAMVVCLVLQFAWSDSEAALKTEDLNDDKTLENLVPK